MRPEEEVRRAPVRLGQYGCAAPRESTESLDSEDEFAVDCEIVDTILSQSELLFISPEAAAFWIHEELGGSLSVEDIWRAVLDHYETRSH